MATPIQPKKLAQVVPLLEKQHKFKVREQHQTTVDVDSQAEYIPIIQLTSKQLLSPRTLAKQVPPYSDPHKRPPPRLPDLEESWRTSTDLETDINTYFEENSSISRRNNFRNL